MKRAISESVISLCGKKVPALFFRAGIPTRRTTYTLHVGMNVNKVYRVNRKLDTWPGYFNGYTRSTGAAISSAATATYLSTLAAAG